MPSKHPIPPSDSSSSSEEENIEDVEEDQTTPLKPSSKPLNSASKSLKKLNSPTTSKIPKPSSSDEQDEEDYGTGSGSESDVPSHKSPMSSTPALDIKPISSKPMSTELPVKRKLETEVKDGKKDKKKKKMSDLVEEDEGGEKKSGEDQKKLFQRIWNDEDEIVILKGMINFIKEQGKDPSAQVTAFFESIKDSLRPDVKKIQLHAKIRTLKRKYQNTTKRVGEDPASLKPHDAKVYKLSKKIWGHMLAAKDEDGETKSVGIESGKRSKSKNKKTSDGTPPIAPPPPAKLGDATLPDGSPVVAVKEEDSEDAAAYPFLSKSLVPQSFSLMPVPPPILGEVFIKKGWGLMGSSKAKGFNQRWRDVMIAEVEAYLQRIDLVKEQTKAMLDVLESI